jgi:shikimate dehydrogenase
MISGRAALAGVVGWPVSQSRSPLLHNAWLARHGIDGAYVPLAVAPADFAEAVRGLRAAGFRGVNVTIPHKEAAFAVCDAVDESARRAGAVNTLVFGAAGVRGFNTDGVGFVANLRAHGVRPEAGPALLLGAGGAARAIAAALMELGVAVSVANRSLGRAAALAAALPGLGVVDWEDRHAAVGECALLVNTSAAGMLGGEALRMDLSRSADGLAVADIVYVPRETALLRDAAARGLRAVGGLGMLLHQAVPGFAAWFGVVPVVDEKIDALVSADIPAR